MERTYLFLSELCTLFFADELKEKSPQERAETEGNGDSPISSIQSSFIATKRNASDLYKNGL